MIELTPLGMLDVSAASGCVVRSEEVWVVADDDVRLRAYALDGTPTRSVSLFPDVLPAAASPRKAVKPDLEALAALPDGSLLALGSGSSPRRRRGAWVRGDEVRVVDCGALFDALAAEFAQLNLEGLVVHEGRLLLGQRGNGAEAENALIALDLAQVIASLEGGRLDGALVREVTRLTLGELEGVPLSLTDLAVGPSGALHFTAAAEDTDDPYLDGECLGSVVGALMGGAVAWSRPVAPRVKLEGLSWRRDDAWVAVADADDPLVRAPLFGFTLR